MDIQRLNRGMLDLMIRLHQETFGSNLIVDGYDFAVLEILDKQERVAIFIDPSVDFLAGLVSNGSGKYNFFSCNFDQERFRPAAFSPPLRLISSGFQCDFHTFYALYPEETLAKMPANSDPWIFLLLTLVHELRHEMQNRNQELQDTICTVYDHRTTVLHSKHFVSANHQVGYTNLAEMIADEYRPFYDYIPEEFQSFAIGQEIDAYWLQGHVSRYINTPAYNPRDDQLFRDIATLIREARAL